MKLTFTVALPGRRGEPRPIRSLALLDVPRQKGLLQQSEVRAGRMVQSLWGDGCEIKLTDVEIAWEECG